MSEPRPNWLENNRPTIGGGGRCNSSSIAGGIFGAPDAPQVRGGNDGRHDPCRSSVDGGVFGGGAWAGEADYQRGRGGGGGSGGGDFLGRLEQAEQRDQQQQQQLYAAQQQQQMMQRQRQQQMMQQQQYAVQQQREQQMQMQQYRQQQQQQMMMMQRQQQQQQQQQQHEQWVMQQQPSSGRQPRGILKSSQRGGGGGGGGSAPPPAERPAAGGYRRLMTEHGGGVNAGVMDYTSSRVLAPPGGASTFSLDDGSGGAGSQLRYPTSQQPGTAGSGSGRAAGAPRDQWSLTGLAPHAQERERVAVRTRNPNASSIEGGIFG